jgi:tRNA (guanine37-N1)-methyltransferase
MRIDVVTLFPRMFDGVIGESILKIAREKGLIEINLVDLRDFTLDKHKKVDAPPFGGGPGMVLMADPVFRAVEHLRAAGAEKSTLVLLSASGTPFDQATARRFAAAQGLILLCGHYEGVDERVVEGLKPLEVSLGDFVLTGGELPAMAVVDAVARLLPGVLGCAGSLEDESFADGRLEYPHYTRPREYRGMKVPDVLLNGNHEEIRKWRRKMADDRTLARRPDLKRKLPE